MKKYVKVIAVIAIIVTTMGIGSNVKTEAATCNHNWVEVFEENKTIEKNWNYLKKTEYSNAGYFLYPSPTRGITACASYNLYRSNGYGIPFLSTEYNAREFAFSGWTATYKSSNDKNMKNAMSLQGLTTPAYTTEGFYYVEKGQPLTVFEDDIKTLLFFTSTGYRCTKCGAMK